MLGASPELPEGIYGYTGMQPLFELERLHDEPVDLAPDIRPAPRKPEPVAHASVKSKKRKKRRNEYNIPKMSINEDAFADRLPDLPYTNTVDVPLDMLDRVRKMTDRRTKDFSELYMERALPTFLGLDAAQAFVTSAMRDGLNVELELENSVSDAFNHIANLDLMFYFLKQTGLPREYKKQLLRELVSETVKHCIKTDDSKNKAAEQRKLADFQSMISRGISSTQRAEDLRRRQERQKNRAQPEGEPLPGMEHPHDRRMPDSRAAVRRRSP